LAEVQARRDSDRATSLDANRVFDRRLALDRMREAIFQLPPQLRDAIVLRDLAELPYARVAEILGVGVQTARLYRCQAIGRLADLIGQETIS
jgi:RNA polymerase sigma-70 factor (ECF subfamily)